MAWTSTDLTTIETAIARGIRRVRFPDGREVEYESITEMLKARDVMKETVSASSNSTRCTYATFTKD